jgi:hypothetical protein
VNWFNKVKNAFQKLKSLPVAPQIKKWGVGLVEQLLRAVGFNERGVGGCPPRQVVYKEEYANALIVEMRVPYCDAQDIPKMNRAVQILAKEALELTPRDTGRLQDSQYTLVFTEDGGKTVVGVVGYEISEVRRFRASASGHAEIVFYALAVHNREAYHGQDEFPNNPPRATWRFLFFALRNREIRSQIEELFK